MHFLNNAKYVLTRKQLLIFRNKYYREFLASGASHGSNRSPVFCLIPCLVSVYFMLMISKNIYEK